jgi:hypothetical protein
MNVDEAMALAKELKAELDVEQEPGMFLSEIAAIVLAAEVERLRDELWEKKAENVDWEESHDRLKAELAAAGDGDTWREACGRVEAELAKVRAELAAAKAASVVPVEIR